jgi:hypothetical protein
MENEIMHDRQFELETEKIQVILEKAANWNLREEVYESAQQNLQDYPEISVIEAYQLAFEEYQTK